MVDSAHQNEDDLLSNSGSYNSSANPYAAFDYLRQLKGQKRINWLLKLDGKHFHKISDAERDVTISILTGKPINTLHQLTDIEYCDALTELKGLDNTEKEMIIGLLREREAKRVDLMEDDIRDFLKNPYTQMSSVSEKALEKLSGRSWHIALSALDLLDQSLEKRARVFEQNGRPHKKYRKNSIQLEKIHFMEICEDFIESLEDGTLPYRILYKKNLNEYLDVVGTEKLPPEQRSMELLLTLAILHDVVEDDENITTESLCADLLKALPETLNEKQRNLAEKQIEYLGKCLKAITFKYNEKLPNGVLLEEKSDHKNENGEPDLNVYSQHMLLLWAASICKGKDRKNGLKGRHSTHILAPNFFNINDDIAYLEDTESVLVHAQLLEKTQKMYPGLSKYITAINEQLEIVFRSFEFVTRNHPRTQISEKRKAKTITASLDISNYATAVSKSSNYHLKLSDIREQYHSLVIESMRYPSLRPAIKGLGGQLYYYLGKGMNALPHAALEIREDKERGYYLFPASGNQNLHSPANDQVA
ncbi:MAG: hypothetical protein KDJ35_04390 [Alphaproteobacteria bacterium]|nr:hypothetical protein [Alphaproteobacteria bacterium]